MSIPVISRSLMALILAGAITGCLSQRKAQVTLKMKWQPGGITQGDQVSLHFQKGSVDCSLNFFQSEDLEKYIKSFGPAEVPVIFDVLYSKSGSPSGALLVRVGEWEASKLRPNERLLSTTQKLERGNPGEAKILKINSPGGCFDPISPE